MYSLLNEFISCIQIKWGKEDFNGDSTTTKNPCGCHFITTGSILLPFTSCPKGEETFGSSWDQVRSSCVRYGQVVWTTFVWRKCKRRCLGLLGNDDRYLKACMANKTLDLLDTEKGSNYLLPYCAKTLRKIIKSYLEPFCLKMNSSEENLCRFLSSKTQSNAYYNYSFVSNPSKNLKMKIALQLSKDERAKFQKFMIKLPPLVPRTTIWMQSNEMKINSFQHLCRKRNELFCCFSIFSCLPTVRSASRYVCN